MKNKKKPYIFKKSDAIAKSDPIACWHGTEDERIHNREIEIMMEISKEVNGNDPVKIVKGVLNQIEYANLVSNL